MVHIAMYSSGYSKEILNKIGKTPKDFTNKHNEYHELTSGGKKYLAEIWEDRFPANDITLSLGISMLYGEMGPVELVKINGGLQLKLGLWEFLSADIKTDRILPELKHLTEESLYGMTITDLIAQDADGLVLKATFNLPYNVK